MDYVQKVGGVPVTKGDFTGLPESVKTFITHWVQVCDPKYLYICDGSQDEANEVTDELVERGPLQILTKYENNYIARTDSDDVARVESNIWTCTDDKYETVPHVAPGVAGILGKWCSPSDAREYLQTFVGCMAGRTMYVIPFSMGPIGSPLSKIGIEITDSNYVLLCMRIMTRVSHDIWDLLRASNEDFVRCIHSVGVPISSHRTIVNNWPCNPDKSFIGHFPSRKEICSFGSGYGGNSLLGKKCYALRIASIIAKEEDWLAEHMLIMGITNEKTGKEIFVAAAFPSACGKTSMAMLTPTLPGYKVRCVGDDIAWMRFDETGQLYAINPEAGFFGVCPGTNSKTNPNVMQTFFKNSIFTNVAMTEDGGFFWEGLEDEVVKCPIIHHRWEDKKGVPISVLIFGGKRPTGVPLVFETFSWEHGVMVGACVKSEATAAAESTGKKIMHDPMAMRPFMGYNFGKYLDHWLSLNKAPNKVPKVFHVNWFRVDEDGKFLWPGFGENIRVLDWIIRRCEEGSDDIGLKSPIGYLPRKGSINLEGLDKPVKWDELFSLPKHYWEDDMAESKRFLQLQVGEDLPKKVKEELDAQEKRINEELFA
ncbi:hypothetical protein ACF0H5_005983 [Mactra antiquata]